MSVHRNVFIGLCACFLLAHRASAVYSMADTCKLYGEGYIADPTNCQRWGYCKSGVLVSTGKCNDGMLYDSKIAMCDFKDKVDCVASKSTMCQGLNAVLKADPDVCSNYCYCNNGKTECAKCPDKQVYNPELQSCVWAVNYPECAANSPCRLVPTNKFVADPNPNNCGGFLRCVSGSGHPGKCQGDYVFNPLSGMCDTFTTVNCPDAPGGNNGNENVRPNIATICKQFNSNDVTKKTQFFSDKLTCEGYVACDSPTNGNWQKCRLGTHFNPVTGSCVTPYSYDCPYDRCGNLDLDFVTAAKTECGKYIACKNRQSVGEPLSCAKVSPAYPYFSENLGGCIAQKPDQAICKAVSPK